MSSLPAPRSLGAWVLAARPKTLSVAVAPVAVGAAVASAEGPVQLLAVGAALLGAIAIQIATNFANDAFDHQKGADDERRIGPPRAVSSGLLSGRAVLLGMVLAFALATLMGSYLAMASGPAIVVIGLASILSGIAYTGGPYPLGYNGLGDVFVFVFFGPVAVLGTTFVASGGVPRWAWVAAVPVGALATAVLVVNNVRDHDGDARSGKRTLVVRFGRAFGVAEYVGLWLIAALAVVALPVFGLASPLALLAVLPMPLGLRLWRTLRGRHDGPTLNRVLAATAALTLTTSSLLALGIALG